VQPAELHDLDGAALGDGPSDHVEVAEEVALVSGAFRALPERWRSVLWLTEVEGMPARQAAAVLGMSPNAVAQLAMRARAGLRRNYLQAHVGNGVSKECKYTVDRLGAYVAGALPRREITKVERHLDGCELCAARLADLEDVGSTLRRFAIIPIPLGLGAAATAKWHGALASTSTELGRSTADVAGRLASSGARRALSAATVAVLGLGLGAVVVGPHRTPDTPTLIAAPPAPAPEHHTVVLTNAEPDNAEESVSSDGTAAPARPALAAGGGIAAAAPTGSTASPVTPQPTSPPPASTPPTTTAPSPRPTPVVQASMTLNLGSTGVGAAAGVGPGACTTLVVLPSTSDCVPADAGPGLTLTLGGALLPTPLTVSLP
jgi:hypothetical protein